MNDVIHHVTQNVLKADLKSAKMVGGGCINSACHIQTNEGSFFLKWNTSDLFDMFSTEARALKILNQQSPVRTPKAIHTDVFQNVSFMLMEWIENGNRNTNFWKNFGINLAKQHRITSNHFGLEHDNFIGSLPQSNHQHSDWYSFFIQERLTPQIRRAQDNGLIDSSLSKQFEGFFAKLTELIPEEPAALLHGDLWSGNFMCSDEGEACIFDPALHYGHRETELAFTHLFGGFDTDFYSFYESEYPIDPGFDSRIDIHNLYPLLVHVNLFGRSYLSGIQQTLNRFVL